MGDEYLKIWCLYRGIRDDRPDAMMHPGENEWPFVVYVGTTLAATDSISLLEPLPPAIREDIIAQMSKEQST